MSDHSESAPRQTAFDPESEFTALKPADFDEKLREIGNYLWSLEQAADLASADEDEAGVDEAETKIIAQAQRAESFLKVAGNHQLLAAFVAGLGYRMARHWDEASHHFLSVLEINPMNGEAWLELTWCLAELGKWEECEIAARKSTIAFPSASASWGNLAMALSQLGKREEAIQAIHRAIELDPNDSRNQAIKSEIGV
jgi:tetratricopeptide (TPR) repeat protein